MALPRKSQDITPEEAERRYGPKKDRPKTGIAAPEYWTEERRAALREQNARLRAEGRWGGPNMGQGRPKIKTANQVIAEKAAERAEQMEETLAKQLKAKSPSVQLRAIRTYLDAEDRVEKARRDDEKEVRRLRGASLERAFLQEAQKLGIELDLSIIDSTATEIGPEELEDGDE